jgi:hypothetical protein
MSFNQAAKKTHGQFSYEDEGATPKVRPTNIDRTLTLESLDVPIPSREAESVFAPGGGRAPIYVTTKRKWTIDGSFTYKVQNGEFIGAIMGITATTGADPYDHDATVADLPYWSSAYALDEATDIIYEFLGCKVNTATFKTSGADQKLVCDVAFMGCKPVKGTTVETLTPITLSEYVFKEGSFSISTMYAAAKARVHEFSLTVNNNLEEEPAPGQQYPYDLVEGYQEYEMTLGVTVENTEEWDEFVDETDPTYTFTAVFTRGASDTITFTGDCKLKGGPLDIDQNAIKQSLEFVPIDVTITTVDSTAAYPFE